MNTIFPWRRQDPITPDTDDTSQTLAGLPSPRRQVDRALYPVDLAHLDDDRRGRRWWQRLRIALADFLAGPGDYRYTITVGIRSYQAELARRSRAILDQRTRDGWWTGPAPYGYRLRHRRVHDATGRRVRRTCLIVDPQRADTVPVIFRAATSQHLAPGAIAAQLAAHPDWYPPPRHPVTGRIRPWTRAAVLAILTNPVYLGFTIRRRTRHGRPVAPDTWVWSETPTHCAVIAPPLFWAAYHRIRRATTTITQHGFSGSSPRHTAGKNISPVPGDRRPA